MKKLFAGMVVSMLLIAAMGTTVFAADSPTAAAVMASRYDTFVEKVDVTVWANGNKVAVQNKAVTSEEYEECISQVERSYSSSTVLAMTDLYLPDNLSLSGSVSVPLTISGISSDDSTENIRVLHMTSTGKWEYLIPTSVKNGVVTVTMSSFSPVVVVRVPTSSTPTITYVTNSYITNPATSSGQTNNTATNNSATNNSGTNSSSTNNTDQNTSQANNSSTNNTGQNTPQTNSSNNNSDISGDDDPDTDSDPDDSDGYEDYAQGYADGYAAASEYAGGNDGDDDVSVEPNKTSTTKSTGTSKTKTAAASTAVTTVGTGSSGSGTGTATGNSNISPKTGASLPALPFLAMFAFAGILVCGKKAQNQ